MSWVEDNKGAGPWPFTEQPDVWGYLNNPRWTDAPGPPVDYTGREDEEPQIWTPDGGGQFVSGSPDHKPCGHWHKVEEGKVIPSWKSEIYYELINREIAMPYLYAPNYEYIYSSVSFISINTNDFDKVEKWEFEVIFCNFKGFDVKIKLVDEDDNLYAEMILGANSEGPTGYELFRERIEFIPKSGDAVYGLRFEIPTGEQYFSYPLSGVISTARIVITQADASKTRLQIPMMANSYNYIFQECDLIYPIESSDEWPDCWGIGEAVWGAEDFTDEWPRGTPDPYSDSDSFTTIWKYDSKELSNVSKVVFSVAAIGQRPSIEITRECWVSTTYDIYAFDLMLYWAPIGTSNNACDSATPSGWVGESQVYVDGCTGATFTPIPGSYVHWEDSPYPYEFNRTLDFSGVPSQCKIFIGGTITEANPQPWGHFGVCGSFEMDLPAEGYVTNAKLHVFSTATNGQTWEMSWSTAQTGVDDLTVALKNMTTDSIVPGSELSWEFKSGSSRKEAVIALEDFSPECEYEFVVKCPGAKFQGNMSGYPPDLLDVQLFLNVNPIEKLTVWQRCVHGYEGRWGNWYPPSGWDGKNIGSRIKLLLCSTAKAYFEQTACRCYSGDEDVSIVALEDYGDDDSSGSGSLGDDVGDGTVQWLTSEGEHKIRKRTSELQLTDGNIYGSRQPGDAYGVLSTNNGFIVLKLVY